MLANNVLFTLQVLFIYILQLTLIELTFCFFYDNELQGEDWHRCAASAARAVYVKFRQSVVL